MMRRPAHLFSRGFTMLELVAALMMLAVVLAVTAQTAYWSMLERGRTRARQAALETAANLLESARALPWERLTAEWAAGQMLPAGILPPESSLRVRVEADKLAPALKRVTAMVECTTHPGEPAWTVELSALFGARTANSAGGQP